MSKQTSVSLPHHFPKTTPIKSLGREFGILFGFLGACLVTMVLYAVVWQAIQRRDTHKERIRRKELRARGYPYNHRPLQDGSELPEKMLDRDPIFSGRAELPPEGQIAELGGGDSNGGMEESGRVQERRA